MHELLTSADAVNRLEDNIITVRKKTAVLEAKEVGPNVNTVSTCQSSNIWERN
jgi:hypothetical protein